jgi:hypothetical protein
MVCNVSGTLNVPALTLNYSYSTTYPVQFPPDLTITENPTGTLAVVTPLVGNKVAFYKDGILDFTTKLTSYTPTVSGNYTAKAEDTVTACLSENFSNAIPLTLTTEVVGAQNTNVKVYPNPMMSSVTITTELSNKLQYELIDLNGTVVRSAEFGTATNINVETLTPGSYVLSIKDNNQKIASYKLIK